jgi:hypothetical protein
VNPVVGRQGSVLLRERELRIDVRNASGCAAISSHVENEFARPPDSQARVTSAQMPHRDIGRDIARRRDREIEKQKDRESER